MIIINKRTNEMLTNIQSFFFFLKKILSINSIIRQINLKKKKVNFKVLFSLF